MSTHIKTLTRIANAIASAVNTKLGADVTLREMRIEYAPLPAATKAKLDAELVHYFASVAGLAVKTRDKGGKDYWCNLVVEGERVDGKNTLRYGRVMTALSRSREALFAAEMGLVKLNKKTGKWEHAKKAAPAAGNAQEVAVAAMQKCVAKALEGGNKAEIKALKREVTALLLLLAS
jgi:hypothetical protein